MIYYFALFVIFFLPLKKVTTTILYLISCAPNCRMLIQKTYPFKAVCKANRKILQGQEFTITYMNLLMPTFVRRKGLRENWYFECVCER